MKSKWVLAFGLLSLLTNSTLHGIEFKSRLINGKPVPPGTYQEVVKIKFQNSSCTATIIGPKTLLTAAHCAPNGSLVEFTAAGKKYTAKIYRSPLYPAQDHDFALGITDQEITGVEPASIGGKASIGLGITLLGYGCTDVGGSAQSDGILRYGETVITEFSGLDMISRKPNGAALCYGDSGGPAFVFDKGRRLLLGVNSKGDIEVTNFNVRTDITESGNFMRTLAQTNGLEICGISKNCGGVVPPAPNCTLSAAPSPITLGQSLKLSLNSTGQVTAASIENQQVALNAGKAEKTITPSGIGNFIATANVQGPGGSSSCSANYTVKEKPPIDPPSCQLSVSPSSIKLGESVTASLTVQGQTTSANIDGKSVSVSGGSVVLKPQSAGNFSAIGTVAGPGGASQCTANYFVEGPQPNVPNFTAVPTYCGDNTILETPIKQVCLSLVKYSHLSKELTIKDVLLVSYRDGSQEIIPLLLRRELRALDENRASQELILYANGAKLKDGNLMLDTRTANLILGNSGTQMGVPQSISGHAVKNGYAFNIERLKKLGE